MLKHSRLKKSFLVYQPYYIPLIKHWWNKLNISRWSFKSAKKIKRKLFKYTNKTRGYLTSGEKILNKIKQKYKKNKKRDYWQLTLLKIPTLLLNTQKQYMPLLKFANLWEQFVYALTAKCQNMFFVVNNIGKIYFPAKKTIHKPWQILKKIKEQHKLTKAAEGHKLKWLSRFYRNFGFRRNKHRFERTLTRTKKFRKFKIYDQILQLAAHKKTLRANNHYPVQSCRMTGPSYYKIREQSVCYWKRNYFAENINKKKITALSQKTAKYKKNRLVKFISIVELSLSSFLLRTSLIKTKGLAQQFIKHGNVCVNYKKVLSPSYNIKVGDTISVYINSKKQKYHRFNDPLYTSHFMQGLYRKNTGRLSLTTQEKQPLFVKANLENLDKMQSTPTLSDKTLTPDILPFKAKDRIRIARTTTLKNFNNSAIANWKFGFLSDKLPGTFVQQMKHVDYINNSLA